MVGGKLAINHFTTLSTTTTTAWNGKIRVVRDEPHAMFTDGVSNLKRIIM